MGGCHKSKYPPYFQFMKYLFSKTSSTFRLGEMSKLKTEIFPKEGDGGKTNKNES